MWIQHSVQSPKFLDHIILGPTDSGFASLAELGAIDGNI